MHLHALEERFDNTGEIYVQFYMTHFKLGILILIVLKVPSVIGKLMC
jgi:cytochrome b561